MCRLSGITARTRVGRGAQLSRVLPARQARARGIGFRPRWSARPGSARCPSIARSFRRGIGSSTRSRSSTSATCRTRCGPSDSKAEPKVDRRAPDHRRLGHQWTFVQQRRNSLSPPSDARCCAVIRTASSDGPTRPDAVPHGRVRAIAVSCARQFARGRMTASPSRRRQRQSRRPIANAIRPPTPGAAGTVAAAADAAAGIRPDATPSISSSSPKLARTPSGNFEPQLCDDATFLRRVLSRSDRRHSDGRRD